ncbi:MAG: DNA adenine methylase [Coriobacteriia bacterium]|nr:DNA adenine methylase [Coriobacteriia bacterium]
MIKYLGSKRTLIPVLGAIARAVEARSALDLFSGTTRVSQEFKKSGIEVTAVDSGTYAHVLAQCYIATDASSIDPDELRETLALLSALPGKRGYFTEVFCEQSRFFQPKNGMRVDAIRDYLEENLRTSPLYPVLLTSLMLAADRVDSTTGVQMAYLKQWAPRAHNDLELRPPELIPGVGHALLGDALEIVDAVEPLDLAYLDPPYNQHRYFTNYHIWETLIRWDQPEYYGVACKRIDSRDPSTKSQFNLKREMPKALHSVVSRVRAETVVLSYNNESWIAAGELRDWLYEAGHERVELLDFDSKRYVGAQIGIFNPSGEKVGKVSHLRNKEHVLIAGPTAKVQSAVDAVAARRPEDSQLGFDLAAGA